MATDCKRILTREDARQDARFKRTIGRLACGLLLPNGGLEYIDRLKSVSLPRVLSGNSELTRAVVLSLAEQRARRQKSMSNVLQKQGVEMVANFTARLRRVWVRVVAESRWIVLVCIRQKEGFESKIWRRFLPSIKRVMVGVL